MILNKAMVWTTMQLYLAVTIMFDWFPRLPSMQASDSTCAIHTYLDALLTNIFSLDPIFYQDWSNGTLVSSRAAADMFKPNWVVFMRPWFARFDLGVCEVKPEGKLNPGAISDKVKPDLEIQAMINMAIAQDLDEPRVCGILVKGFPFETYIMDRQQLPVYRHVLLDFLTLPSCMTSFFLFPSVLRCLLQIKLDIPCLSHWQRAIATFGEWRFSRGSVAKSIPHG